MAGLVLTQVAAELGAEVQNRPTAIMDALYNAGELEPYLKEMTRVDGKFPSVHKIISNLLQKFSTTWSPMGDLYFKAKNLKGFDLKFNVPIVPDEFVGTWLSMLRKENLSPAEQPIAAILLNEITSKVAEDANYLMQAGVYTGNPLDFEGSMDGLATQVTNAVNNADNPAYLIPIAALDATNAWDEISKFEKAIPKKAARNIKQIFTSINNYHNFIDSKYAITGNNPDYSSTGRAKTFYYGWDVVGLTHLPDNCLFATVNDNILKLTDIFNMPSVNDIQVQDYELKVFGAGLLGIDFAINQYVFVANFDDTTSGFGQLSSSGASADMLKLYFLGQS